MRVPNSMIVTLPQAISDHTDVAPERTAVRFLDQTLSYAQLDQASNRLARALADHGVRRRDRVGIYMEKSLRTPIALYGIMKAGAAYVPLDPSAAPDRVSSMIRDCGIGHLVSSNAKRRPLRDLRSGDNGALCVVGIDSINDAPHTCISWDEVESQESGAPAGQRTIGDDIAYIIYTSGSTGVPKGIVHTHDSCLAFSRWAASEYALGTDDILSNHAPLHFDLSILDYFAGAVVGCTTAIIPEEHTKLPPSYAALIAEQHITVLYTVPFALVQLLLRGNLHKHDFSALRWAIFGGEPMSTKHLAALMRALPHVRFDNIYGPAEVNGVTHYEVESLRGDEESIPIGPMGAHTEALIVDEDDNEVERGEVGELLVRSPSMMKGYWSRAELNARAFFKAPALPEIESVFYRTGDLVREDESGRLWFLGRKDRQVKVRGYRVELDEVEAAIAQHPAVEEAGAIVIPDDEGAHSIGAAVTLNGRAADDSSLDFTGHSKRYLPWYAVPSEISILQSFPRTSTGKIDRRALRDLLADETRGVSKRG